MSKSSDGWTYFSRHFCKSCNGELGYHEKMHSDGVCPCCGWSSKGTICKTNEVVYRRRKTSPWWKFWESTYEEEQFNG